MPVFSGPPNRRWLCQLLLLILLFALAVAGVWWYFELRIKALQVLVFHRINFSTFQPISVMSACFRFVKPNFSTMKSIVITLWLWIGLTASFAQSQQKSSSRASSASFPAASYATAKFVVQPIPAEANTWGFEIYADGKRLIRQLSIPALPGNRGFATQELARKAGGLMVDKLRQGQMPPSLTKEELQKAHLI